jgi:anti-sigma B factor antagonist
MEFRVENHAGRPVAIATLNGRLDALNSRQFQKNFGRWLRATNHFVFDCSSLDFLDSSGLGAVVACLRKTLAAGGDLRLAALGPKVKMVLELTQAEQLFAVYPNLDEALFALAD